MAEVVELFGVALGLSVLFGADFEVGEELAEEGGVLVLELEMGAAFACFDEADFDELLHMRGEVAITEAEDRTKLGDGDFMLLHEEEKAQTVGIGKSGEKGEQGGHGGGGCSPRSGRASKGNAESDGKVTIGLFRLPQTFHWEGPAAGGACGKKRVMARRMSGQRRLAS